MSAAAPPTHYSHARIQHPTSRKCNKSQAIENISHRRISAKRGYSKGRGAMPLRGMGRTWWKRPNSLCNPHGEYWTWSGPQYTPLQGSAGLLRHSYPPCYATAAAAAHHFPNTFKKYNNWNVCYSCGFDVENGHTSMMCPFCKATHQTGFKRRNAQQYIAVGHNPCTRGMHKFALLTNRYN